MIAETAAEGLTLAHRFVPLLAAGAVTLVTIELIRRRKLREEFAMLWVGASVVLLVFALIPQLLGWISNAIGVYYVTLMVLMLFCFLSMLIIHLAVAASRSADDTQQIAQRLALLEQKLETLTRENDRPADPSEAETASPEQEQ